MFCGNPRPVADQMEEWFTAPACDGFVLAATSMPGAYDDAVRLLVPELQRRGLFQK
jgi:alkanesulfonate monooxygenase SsuD/methylene tetrahydromethanopterin reductase-like flavin-dependent oxidoreductase (luciferase family)